jgi:hypothetical protein
MNREQICAFLHFGHLPPSVWRDEHVRLFVEFTRNVRKAVPSRGMEELVEEGAATWREVFSEAAAVVNIVPLSGGLDSRAILGGLLSSVSKERLVCVTFGQTGSLDYEIGLDVAESTGVESVGIDLDGVPLERERLVGVAATLAPCWLFDAFYNRLMFDSLAQQGTWWSGYIGDTLAGSRLPVAKSCSWEEAVSRFCRTFRMVRSARLVPDGYSPVSALPQIPLGDETVLSFDEQMNLFARQPHANRPVLLDPRADVRTPFLDPRWRSFILEVPRSLRVGKAVYKRILMKAFPDLMHLPEKGNYGLPADARLSRVRWAKRTYQLRHRAQEALPMLGIHPDPTANYLDFDHAIRHREDVRSLVRDALRSLRCRGVVDWVNMEVLWRRHVRGLANHADALMMLTALDLNLEAEDRRELS